MDTQHYVMLALGLAILAFVVWCRRGRSEGARHWVGSDTQERAVLMVLPAFAIVLVLAGVLPLTESSRGAELVLGLLLMLSLLVGLWGMLWLPIPRWTTPRWYRTATAYRTEARRKLEEEKRRSRRQRREGSREGDG